MTKTVFDNYQVAHVWASRTQDYGRSHNGNFSFQGLTLYSYRTPIARFVPLPRGRMALLITSETFSVTTSGKHMTALRAAIRGHADVVFYVPFVGGRSPYSERDQLVSNLRYYRQKLDEAMDGLRSARVNSWKAEDDRGRTRAFNQFLRGVREYDSYAQTFKLKGEQRKLGYSSVVLTRSGKHVRGKITRHAAMDEALRLDMALAERRAKWEATRHEQAEKRRKAEESRLARLRQQYPSHDQVIAAWMRLSITTDDLHRTEKLLGWQRHHQLCRVHRSGQHVETDLGAQVPLQPAIDLMRALPAAFAGKIDLAGQRIGHFRVNRLYPEQGAVSISCHTLKHAEMLAAYEAWQERVDAGLASLDTSKPGLAADHS